MVSSRGGGGGEDEMAHYMYMEFKINSTIILPSITGNAWTN